jgi:hypothetical protein
MISGYPSNPHGPHEGRNGYLITPAMVAGVAYHVWPLSEIAALLN